MRRRVLALALLTTTTVVTGSIAAADGPDVNDLAQFAMGTQTRDAGVTAAEATDVEALEIPTDEASPAVELAARAPVTGTRAQRLAEEPGQTVRASWYGPGFHGRRTANGEVYDQWALTAAHKTLPFGTMLRVTNTANGKSVVVRINDRGPYVSGRSIDLSRAAAEAIGMGGVATVVITEI